MNRNSLPTKPIDKLVSPIQKFIQQEKSGGLVLGISVLIALLIANSPWSSWYHELFNYKFGFQFNGNTYFNYSIHHWINDGLMAIFFFVVGLELKREIIAGELSNPRKALLPIAAAIGGMIVPALIYFGFNYNTDAVSGWGIPMATDIAFALGVLYLLGNRIPLALKVFLTALAIVDDLGAVLVIALFYTSDISMINLCLGIGVLICMYLGNKLGIRSIIFYAILGIGGVWTAFLLSGVHATIAAVLAAFTIPADVRIKESFLINSINKRMKNFEAEDKFDEKPTLTNEQLHHLELAQKDLLAATPPLQRLEHAMHPLVAFIIIPIFALANAGVTLLDIDFSSVFSSSITLGVGLGLLIGKVVGVVGFTFLCIVAKIAPRPEGMSFRNLIGLGFLAAIGFTMSLFVTELAFDNNLYNTAAKVGIFAASILGGIIGYIILSKNKAST